MKNKYIIAVILAATIVMSVAFLSGALAAKPDKTGNDTPRGYSYNLQVIALNHTKGWSYDPLEQHDNGQRIFVLMNRDYTSVKTQIHLVPGDSFAVIDPDGTDGHATIQVMDPYDNDYIGSDPLGAYNYEIYVRALGKKNDNRYADITLNAESSLYPGIWYLGETVTIEPSPKGTGSKFKKETVKLTTFSVDGTPYHLFDDGYENFFWDYDNHGLRHLQMRFYGEYVTK